MVSSSWFYFILFKSQCVTWWISACSKMSASMCKVKSVPRTHVTMSSLALLMALLWISRSKISSCHPNGTSLQNFWRSGLLSVKTKQWLSPVSWRKYRVAVKQAEQTACVTAGSAWCPGSLSALLPCCTQCSRGWGMWFLMGMAACCCQNCIRSDISWQDRLLSETCHFISSDVLAEICQFWGI